MATMDTLPLGVLGQCLSRSAFATCKRFAKALLRSSPKSKLSLRLKNQRVASALALAAQLDEQVYVTISGLETLEPPFLSLVPLLRQLRQEAVILLHVTHLCLWFVRLDAPEPLAAVFPSLQHLKLRDCRIAAGVIPLAGCTRLSVLELCAPGLDPPTNHRADWLPQLQQLASLPSLQSLTLKDVQGFPTSFLPLLADQLTDLCMHKGSASDPGTQQLWTAALSDATHLSGLRKLTLFTCTANQLGALLPLTQLQDLTLCCSVSEGDGIISTLLQFPHLTRLAIRGRLLRLRQSYAEQPCSWRQLRLFETSPEVLARLPLHSLTLPLQLYQLNLSAATTVADVQAAVANLARSQAPTVDRWDEENDDDPDMEITLGSGKWYMQGGSAAQATAFASLLRAAAPLVPPNLKSLLLSDCWLNAELLLALQQLAPQGLTGFTAMGCVVDATFWPQLARSFPRLQFMCAHIEQLGSAVALMGYYVAVAQGQQQPGTPARAAKVQLVTGHEEYDDEGEEWVGSMEEVKQQLALLGFESELELMFM